MLSNSRNDKSLVLETLHWEVVLASDQSYLGSSVVSLKRSNCGDLADLTNDELLDFLQLVKKLEFAVRGAFDATLFNWSCLMNSSYLKMPPNPHVHWQFIPRYNKTKIFSKLKFTDSNFGQHYKKTNSRNVEDAVKENILKEIKKFI